MRDRKFLIIAAVLLILAGVGAYFLFTFLFKPTDKQAPTPQEKVVSGNLYEITQKGGDQVCTWEKTEDGATVNSTLYVSGGKFAMDTQTKMEDTAIMAHLIGDGKKVYMWTDVTDIPGVTIEYAQLQNPSANTQNQNGIIYQKMEYSCKKWTPQEDKFTLPPNITFR